MSKKHFFHLFRRYANGQATEKEKGKLMLMVKSGQYDDWIKNQIDGGLAGVFHHADEEDLDMSVEKADQLLRNILNTTPKKTTKKIKMHSAFQRYSYPRPSTNGKWIAAVAVVLLTVVFSLNIDWVTGDREKESVQEVAMQEIITNRGERTSLILGDGSRVTLNSSSRLQIPQDYGRHSRTLVLDGEAFFEVEHNSESPFRVYIGDHVYTEVLGTKFNVRSYGANDVRKESMIEVDVVVSEGSVRLGSLNENQPNTAVVRAGQLGEIGENGIIGVSRVFDLNKYIGWTNGQLIFDDQYFGRVIFELEKWFDIDITVTDSTLLERRLTASFEGDTLSEVLQVVAQSLQIDIKRESRKVEFSPKN